MKSNDNYLVIQAFSELFPEREFNYIPHLRYSSRFSDYNANVRLEKRVGKVTFSLSRNWETVSDDIKLGLIQELFVKLLKEKKQTMNMDLYNAFLKNIHIAAPKLKSDDYLVESFNRVNDSYFYGMIDQPNLIWGEFSKRKLGSYRYGSDTITMSKVLETAPIHLLDYVMYHEVLHKKHKFHSKNGRNYHHTREFRNSEQKFENYDLIESQLETHVRYARQKKNIPKILNNQFIRTNENIMNNQNNSNVILDKIDGVNRNNDNKNTDKTNSFFDKFTLKRFFSK